MTRRSKSDKVITSIYISKESREAALLSDQTDGDIYDAGLEAIFKSTTGTTRERRNDTLQKILTIKQNKIKILEEEIVIIKSLIKPIPVWVRDKGDDVKYVINPEDFDSNKHVRIK